MAEYSLLLTVSGGLLKNNNLKGFRGFTLAEVLITLVIIGVIAAMTIPTLINKTNNQELVSRLKKTYSTMAQATQRIIAEEGQPRADIGGWATSNEAVFNMYKKYLSKAKECSGRYSGCLSEPYKALDGSPRTFDSVNKFALVMADGAEIYIADAVSEDCSSSYNGVNGSCQAIIVDVNGGKKPNTLGRDTFKFALKENGLVPVGCDTSVDICTASGGWGCACKVLREGAMNY